MRALTRPDEVVLRLRPEDAEILWAYCESAVDQVVGPDRWIWWRIRQACVAAFTAAGDPHVVDRHVR